MYIYEAHNKSNCIANYVTQRILKCTGLNIVIDEAVVFFPIESPDKRGASSYNNDNNDNIR